MNCETISELLSPTNENVDSSLESSNHIQDSDDTEPIHKDSMMINVEDNVSPKLPAEPISVSSNRVIWQ